MTRNPASSARVPIGTLSASTADTVFSWSDPTQRTPFVILIGASALVIWAFWGMFVDVAGFWDQPQYSHGWIIPLISLFLMWSRRPNPVAHQNMEQIMWGLAALGGGIAIGGVALGIEVLQGIGLSFLCLGIMACMLWGQPFASVSHKERWTGLAIILAAVVARYYGTLFDMMPAIRFSFVVTLFGLFLMVGGWQLIKWAGPAVGFLLFMFPVPAALEGVTVRSLQKISAVASEAIFVILGVNIVRDGNYLKIQGLAEDVSLEVAEACSGLSMSTIFIGMTIAMAFVIDRPWWDRFIVVLSAIPIALTVNIVRIVATGLLYMAFPGASKEGLLHLIIHDGAGLLLMMPLAMGLLLLEFKILSRLSTPEAGLEQQGRSVMLGRGGASMP